MAAIWARLPSGLGRERRVRIVAAGFLVALLLGLVLRFGAETPAGRALVLNALEGLRLGTLGQLHIAGVKGDVWRDFTVAEARVVDARGAWIEARNVRIRWRWAELLRRKVHVLSLTADSINVVRRPNLGGNAGGGPAPVSMVIDHLATTLLTQPEFSGTRGDFRLLGDIDLERSGAASGGVILVSRLHAGDGLETRFSVGPHKPLLIEARAHEGRGGALAVCRRRRWR